jgi:hypothetical protein
MSFTPYIPSSKPHIHFVLCVSFQSICHSLRPCVTFSVHWFFYGEELLVPSSNLRAQGPTLASCLWLLMHYAHQCPLYLGGVTSILNLKACHTMVTGNHIICLTGLPAKIHEIRCLISHCRVLLFCFSAVLCLLLQKYARLVGIL